MNERQLEDYLYREIPLSKAMGVRVLEAAPMVRLVADLAPNLNHKRTAFGGSLYALAVLAGWSAMKLQLDAAGLKGEIVIGKSACRYVAPAREDFVAEARPFDAGAWERFKEAYRRKGKAPFKVEVRVQCGGREVVHFQGSYVVVSAA